MSVEIKETSATVRTLEITIPQADLTAPFEKKLGQYKKQVSMKGFRQGMVPKAMILKQFGGAIRQEAVDEVVNKLVQEALKNANIIPVGQMKVVDFKDDKENDIALKVHGYHRSADRRSRRRSPGRIRPLDSDVEQGRTCGPRCQEGRRGRG